MCDSVAGSTWKRLECLKHGMRVAVGIRKDDNMLPPVRVWIGIAPDGKRSVDGVFAEVRV